MKFKKKIAPVCALILALTAAAPANFVNANTVNSYLTSEIHKGIEIEHLGDGEFSIRLDETTGNYYLTREIHQGIEIHILGGGSFSIYVDPNTEDNYLITGNVQGNEDYLEGLEPLNETMDIQPRHPAGMENAISTTHDGRLIQGHWWGGIDGLTVVARTQSSTSRSQSRASVTTGNGTTSRGNWSPKGSTSSVSRSVSISGTNLANWDLESTEE